jgi:hypothetical protein
MYTIACCTCNGVCINHYPVLAWLLQYGIPSGNLTYGQLPIDDPSVQMFAFLC